MPPSPAVRRIAEESGIAPSSVTGTGKDGRVTKGDMLAASPSRPATATPSVAVAAPSATAEGKTTRRKMTPLRKRIAERLVASQQQTASLTTFNEVDMSAIMALRVKHQEAFVAKYGTKLGFMSFFVKAVVHALKELPNVNAQLDGDELIENHYYDIGVAVGTERGLVVPVVRNCDTLGFADIEKSIAGYAKKARDGKISLDDLQGGVFTITNGGTYGSLLSTPIINSPQSAILGMHSIQERAVVVDGQIVVRPMMYTALTYDHQVIDGKEAVTFLVKIKQAIEDPTRLLFSI
ncbi:MAG: dihydrolipoamide succinyltransferase [Verrucomicrobia bacterium 21-51-4]|nr:MAG: dihydrolipoamide succinyltransferase [Verrucomicrobia bacterium 21-51-4]